MSHLARYSEFFLSLADTLIPAYGNMPAFSNVCTIDDAARCIAFRPDIAEDFERAVSRQRIAADARPPVMALAADDPAGFFAVGLIVVSAYHMSPRIRELIGYPGQQSIPIQPGDAEHDLRDGLLDSVIARGVRYVPTPLG